jgi:hypothetical protein
MLLYPETWVAFLTLLALEIVLPINTIIFILILVDKLAGGEADVAGLQSRGGNRAVFWAQGRRREGFFSAIRFPANHILGN